MKRHSSLLVISAIQLFLFIPLTWWVRAHPVNHLDLTVTRTVQHLRSPLLSALSRALGLLCSWQLVTLGTFPLTYLLWKARQRVEAVTILSVAVLGTAFREGIQRLIARPRPQPELVYVAKENKSPSFPSGHATTAVTGWGWLLVLAAQQLKGKPTWRNAALCLILSVIALTGPSRVYLGEHWPTDVLGGYLYGGACFSLSLYLCSLFKERAS